MLSEYERKMIDVFTFLAVGEKEAALALAKEYGIADPDTAEIKSLKMEREAIGINATIEYDGKQVLVGGKPFKPGKEA